MKANTSGSTAVTETLVPTAPLTLSFTITCTTAQSGLSSQATAKVTENPLPAIKSGGGGAIDWLFVIFLLATTGSASYAQQCVTRANGTSAERSFTAAC
jgi:hypothetical protein